MPEYLAPGVYVEEIPAAPRAIEGVATAQPVFIGYTARTRGPQGEDLTGRAVEVASLRDYERRFGPAPVHPLTVTVEKRVSARGRLLGVEVDWLRKNTVPRHFMNYALQLYFRNGGGPCLVWSLGRYGRACEADYRAAIAALENLAGPTLVVLPDAVKLDDAGHAGVLQAALASVARTRDRFLLADVRNARPGGSDDAAAVDLRFRAALPDDSGLLQFGAAYFPYLETGLRLRTAESRVTLRRFDVVTVARGGRERRRERRGAAGRRLNDRRLALERKEPEVYRAVQDLLKKAFATLPPSSALAGVCARVDATRGVWKAPAGEAVIGVRRPAVAVDDALQQALAVDPAAGKSVNPLRRFTGRGTLVWGARTLAGNDSEWRYVNVRRFAIFLERSLHRGTQWAVFEPNDANTWARVQAAVENFLTGLWREGALQGAKPEQAYFVALGLGRSMTQNDVLNGRLIIEVGFAPLRPAEFVILRLTHKVHTE